MHQLPRAQGLHTQPLNHAAALPTPSHSYADCPSNNSPVLVEQAGRVLLLGLCPVAGQELAQEALPCGLALTPQVPEDLRGLLLRLQDRTGQYKPDQPSKRDNCSAHLQVSTAAAACRPLPASLLLAAHIIPNK